MAAIDFTSVEIWTKSGLVTSYLLFVMELKTRRAQFAGCATSPDECRQPFRPKTRAYQATKAWKSSVKRSVLVF